MDKTFSSSGSASFTGLDILGPLNALIQTYALAIGGSSLICIVCIIACSLMLSSDGKK
jgi:hypothetical protein